MSFLLGCEKVSIDFPTKSVFEGVSLGVDEGDRSGIVGRNGDGKSTLLRLLSGLIKPDSGRIIRTHGVSVGLLGQTDELDDTMSVEHAVVGDMPAFEWASNVRIRSIIAGLLDDIDWLERVGTLSGGQRRRVDLARLLVGDWDVLMLDEPTNHLDMRGISWLAKHLADRWRAGRGALLVVTHDRWFLDEVCTSMWEVHNRGINEFSGGFSAYVMQRVERDRLACLAEQKRQNQLRRELAWLSRGARARSSKPKFHVAAAEALVADVPELRNPIELKRMAVSRLGKQVVDLQEVSVVLGGKTILDNLTWSIGPGDRLGIVGVNGVGKTTLLNVICGEQKCTSGNVKIGKSVRFAVLSQHLDDLMQYGNDRVRRVVERFPHRTMFDGKDTTPAQLLERLGFSAADMDEPVCDLSGGQARRLALMFILLDEPNFLILDEPGNDLDIDMLAAVEDLLDGWPGTLLLVTHDRYLMERVTDDQFALIDGKLRHLPGGVNEYLEIMAERENATEAALQNLEAGASKARLNGNESFASGTSPGTSLSGGEQRTLRKLMASSEKKIETLKRKIESKQAEMDSADPTDYVALAALQDDIASLETSIEELELEWLDAAEKLGG